MRSCTSFSAWLAADFCEHFDKIHRPNMRARREDANACVQPPRHILTAHAPNLARKTWEPFAKPLAQLWHRTSGRDAVDGNYIRVLRGAQRAGIKHG